MDPRPIGIFDSGIGGLTVLRQLSARLPGEQLVYLGDTARLPYGTKSPETIVRYSLQNAEFLLGKGIKLLVVACNSASSVAIPRLREEMPVPVLGVIQPGAERAAGSTRSGVVGVIGTRATIASGAYERAITALHPRVRLISRACPLFVPLVEEGWVDNEICRLTVASYLGDLKGVGLDTLVLGCTHYPLLKQAIGAMLGSGVTLIDSAEAVAGQVSALLDREGLERGGGRPAGEHEYFYVTDASERFREVGERCLGRHIGKLELVDIVMK
jgi:glutamate racemase